MTPQCKTLSTQAPHGAVGQTISYDRCGTKAQALRKAEQVPPGTAQYDSKVVGVSGAVGRTRFVNEEDAPHPCKSHTAFRFVRTAP